MILTTGSKIVYPSQGPCLIGSIVERIIGEQPRRFYQLLVLNECGGDLFVPVEKIEAVGIRLLLNVTEIPKLLEHLNLPATVADNHRQRGLHILKLFASGSAFDLAEIVGSLTELNNTKPLSFGENKTLEKAKGLLICEMAEVTGTTREAVKQQIETALETRKKESKASPASRRRVAANRDQLLQQAASG